MQYCSMQMKNISVNKMWKVHGTVRGSCDSPCGIDEGEGDEVVVVGSTVVNMMERVKLVKM